jgi:ubiquinone/menaquinone biosynthesis C-methylase UbiE
VVSTEQVIRKYNAIADRYEDIFFYAVGVGQQLVNYADPSSGTRMLDVGAGRGAVARAGLARGCIVTAVDASPRMVELLGSDFPEITIKQMDVDLLDFADGSFDLVTAGLLMQVLDDPVAAIAEIRRVLAPAGVLALSLDGQSVGRLQWLHELNVEFFSLTHDDTAVDQDIGPMTDQDVGPLLAQAGFVDVTQESVEMPFSMSDPSTLWNWLISQGLKETLQSMPDERIAEFRKRFFVGAEHMHTHGGIVLDFDATLHRAHAPK